MKLAVLCSLFLSILHSILFYGQKWGISVFLFSIVGLFLWIQLLEKQKKIKNRKALWLALPIVILSLTYFIFNNSFFHFFNMVIIVLLFFIMTIFAVLGTLKIHTILENIFILLLGPAEELTDATKEISNCFSKSTKEEQNNKSLLWKKIGKGILYSLPLLIIVMVLLITADEMFAFVFQQIFSAIFQMVHIQSIYHLLFRLLLIMAFTIYLLGMLIKIEKQELNDQKETNCFSLKIEGITFNTLLTLLNIIYFVFSMTQVISFMKQLQATNLNYAQYARTGFFQLMAVSIINFVVIVLSKRNQKEVSSKTKKYTKVMNVFLAIFTIIILLSSVVRMNLYAQEYGYTFLRLMVYFIQITELILIIPILLYIVKEKFSIWPWVIGISITMYLIINFINIDAIIARRNINRYFSKTVETEQEIDFTYLSEKTSIDALPEMIRLLETKDLYLQEKVNYYLLEQYKELKKEQSWQAFNLARQKAKKELEKIYNDETNQCSNQ